MCFPTVLPKQDLYIVKYTPHADMSISHHMLVYGCEVPRSNEPYECQTMGVCKTDYNQIVYGWAMNAPALALPENTGFHVGGNTKIQTLVLQFHYKKIGKWNGGNGVDLTYLSQEPARLAGIYLMATGGSLPPHRTTNLDAACTYDGDAVLTPIAYRTHAHTWCEVISGYRVRGQQWNELGRHSPQLPQMFYPVENAQTKLIRKGDVLASRCHFKNTEDRTINIGSTHNDEMCNFYMMYSVSAADKAVLQSRTLAGCFTEGDAELSSLGVNTGYPATSEQVPAADVAAIQMHSEDDHGAHGGSGSGMAGMPGMDDNMNELPASNEMEDDRELDNERLMGSDFVERNPMEDDDDD